MITWTRDAAGWKREGELPAGDVFILTLQADGEFKSDVHPRFARNEAMNIIESGIAKGQVRAAGYRLVPAPPRPISEETRARLAELRARRKEDEASMPKKAVKTRRARSSTPKVKGEGRKPTLAPFIDGAMDIHAEYKEKKFTAKVAADGVITCDGKTFTSPSAAGKHCIRKEVDGWKFWKHGEGEKELPLDSLRGKKSPLAEAAA